MEVVGWSPSEELQHSDMFKLPPLEGWSGAEDGDPSPRPGPSSCQFPKPSTPHLESATVYQRRLKDPEHVRRPRNAFIIFRCDYTHNYIANGGSERAPDMEKISLSKRAGEAWKNEKPETKRYYKKLAEEERARHRIDHPDYRFRPRRQKPAGQAGGRRSPKRRASSPHPKRSAGRSSTSSVGNHVLQNDPLQIQTITVPTSSSTLSQPHPSRQSTPDFLHGYGSTTPASPCSPLSPVDDIIYMPRPTIAARNSDSLLSYTMEDSQFYGYPKDPLAPFPDDFSLFGPTYTAPDPLSDPAPQFPYPPLAAVASSLAGWDGQGRKDDMNPPTPRPFLHHESDFVNSPFLPLSLSDGSAGYLGMPFGSDPLSLQCDMEAYRMGLKEYGITPASNQ